MKSISIQGKNYIQVHERLKEFRENLKYEGFRLCTELIEVNAESALIKATIYDNEGNCIAQGTAFEVAGSSFINKGSHVENAETSAWGRALGNLGIGIDASVATADEVANAMKNQDKPARVPAKPKMVTPNKDLPMASTAILVEIDELAKSMGGSLLTVYQTFHIVGHPDAPTAEKMLNVLKEKKAQMSKELDSSAS